MKTIKFIVKMMVAAVVAIGVACLLAETLAQFTAVSIFGGILCALVMGAFDVRDKTRYNSIRHYDGRRNYGQAAVFIGTACLFIGSPKQCEDMADDLWHYGQQAKVTPLTGEETFEIL